MELLGDFAGSAVVRLSAFPAVAGVQSLVRELKSCKSCNLAKKKKKKKDCFILKHICIFYQRSCFLRSQGQLQFSYSFLAVVNIGIQSTNV